MPVRKAVLLSMADLFPLIWLRIAKEGHRSRALNPSFHLLPLALPGESASSSSDGQEVREKEQGPHGLTERRTAQGGLEHLGLCPQTAC